MLCEHHIKNTLSLQFANLKDHLAPHRFKCWTNQISIGISQPLAQLQRRYNVEIPRVSLPDDRLKWDFRTDSENWRLPVNLGCEPLIWSKIIGKKSKQLCYNSDIIVKIIVRRKNRDTRKNNRKNNKYYDNSLVV